MNLLESFFLLTGVALWRFSVSKSFLIRIRVLLGGFFFNIFDKTLFKSQHGPDMAPTWGRLGGQDEAKLGALLGLEEA